MTIPLCRCPGDVSPAFLWSLQSHIFADATHLVDVSRGLVLRMKDFDGVGSSGRTGETQKPEGSTL